MRKKNSFFQDSVQIAGTMIVSTLSFAALVALATAHGNQGQKPIAGPHKSLWYNTLPGDGGTQVSSSAERCNTID